MASASQTKRVLSILAQLKDHVSPGAKAAVKALKLLQASGRKSMQALAAAARIPLQIFKALTNPVNLFRAALASLPFVAVIGEASHAQQVFAKFDAVFKESADAAYAWADDFSDAVGRSRTQIASEMAQLQDTFVPLGFAREQATELSKTLTRLGTDLAAFNPQIREDQQAIDALTAALVGSHESVRTFGVILNETTLEQELFNAGITTGIENATEQQKVMARLAVILKGTADAHDFAVENADKFANAQKRLRGAIQDVTVALGTPFLGPLSAAATQLADFLHENEADVEAFARALVINFGVAAKTVAAFGEMLYELLADPTNGEAIEDTLKIAGDLALDIFTETVSGGFRILGNVLQIGSRPLIHGAELLAEQIGARITRGVLTAVGQLPARAAALIPNLPGLAQILDIAGVDRDILASVSSGVVAAQVNALLGEAESTAEDLGKRLAEEFNEAADDILTDVGDIQEAASTAVQNISAHIADAEAAFDDLAQGEGAAAEAAQRFLDKAHAARAEMEALVDGTGEAEVSTEHYADALERVQRLISEVGTEAALTATQIADLTAKQEAAIRSLDEMLFQSDQMRRESETALLTGQERARAEIDNALRSDLRSRQRWLDEQLRMLDEFHAQALISEEEYLMAIEQLNRDHADIVAAVQEEAARARREATEDATAEEKELLYGLERAFGSFFDGIIQGTKSTSEAWKDLGRDILSVIGQILSKGIANAIVGALFPSESGAAFSNGNVLPFAKGGVIPFAEGGVVTRPTIFPMSKGLGLMGEAGPEAVMPLRRGPGGRLGVDAVGGGAPTIIEHHHYDITIKAIDGPSIERVFGSNEAQKSIAQQTVRNFRSKRDHKALLGRSG